MNSETSITPSSAKAGIPASGNTAETAGKEPWTAPLLSRLDGQETQAITPHSPAPDSSIHHTPELFMGS